MEEVPGSEKFFPAQLVFLALGFLGPQAEVIKALGLKQDARSNIQTPNKVGLSFNPINIIHNIKIRNTRPILKACSLREIVVAASR